MYRTPKTTLIGDVLVRFSKRGDFELTFENHSEAVDIPEIPPIPTEEALLEARLPLLKPQVWETRCQGQPT